MPRTAGNLPLPAPRRVLMTTDTIGGVWTYALELARGLSKHDVQVHLATMGKRLTTSERREAAGIRNVILHESTYRLEWMENPWPDVERAGEWLLALEEETAPDLVHLNGYVHASLPWRAPRLVVAHSCVLSWWQAVKREPLPQAWHEYRDRVAGGIADADLVVAPTATMLREIERCYLSPPRGMVINNARRRGLFRPGKKENFLLAVGRIWDEGKNIRLLAENAPSLPWPVLVAGSDRHPDGSAITIPHVRHLGILTSSMLAPLFASAAVYVLPARYEPFGLTVLEAALSGCALVIGDIPSLRELWDDAALFVPPDDGEQLRKVIKELCAHRSLREEFSAKALKRSERYLPEKMTDRYLSAYEAVLSLSCHKA